MMAELTDIEKKIIRQVEVGNLLVLIISVTGIKFKIFNHWLNIASDDFTYLLRPK